MIPWIIRKSPSKVQKGRSTLALTLTMVSFVLFYLAAPAFAYLQYSHQWIGVQAHQMLEDGSAAKEEIREFLGIEGGDCNSIFAASGATILDGLWEEDCDVNFFKHFWDPDTDRGLGVEVPGEQRAVAYAEELFADAIRAYRSERRGDAYYLLGRVAHLLQDMAQPAHVHNDQHACCDDNFEKQVDSFITDYRYVTPRDSNDIDLISFLTDGEGYPLSPVDYKALPFNIVNSGSRNYEPSRDTHLFRLFYNLAETADFFESEEDPGDIDHIQFNQLV